MSSSPATRQAAILGRLAEPRSFEALRRWYVQAEKLGSSTDFGTDIHALSADVVVILMDGYPMLRRATAADAIASAPSNLHELPAPDPEDRARQEAWNRIGLRARALDELAEKDVQIAGEKERIKPAVDEANRRHKAAITSLEAVLSSLKGQRAVLSEEAERHKEAALDTFSRFRDEQRKREAARDSEGAAAADRIGRARQLTVEGV